jgi:hypothetical protein
MAGGAIASGGAGRCQEYKGKTTGYVIITCIVAASAGLLFGYDNGKQRKSGQRLAQARSKDYPYSCLSMWYTREL